MTEQTLDSQLLDGVRAFLREHPGVSKKRVNKEVPGPASAALDALIQSGEARYVPPERVGEAGKCFMVNGNGPKPVVTSDANVITERAPNGPQWKASVRCPGCGLSPPIRFSEREVLRARRDRQSAHLQEIICNRPRCRTKYWIRAEHVAAARLDRAS